MSSQPLKCVGRAASFGALLIALAAPTPAHAERWQDLAGDARQDVRIDLDAVQRVDDEVIYRLEFISRRPDANAVRAVSSAIVDCRQRRRKGIEIEHFFANGSSKKGLITTGWMTIQPGTVTDKVRKLFCVDQS